MEFFEDESILSVRIKIYVSQLVAFHVDELVLDGIYFFEVGANPRNKWCLAVFQGVYIFVNITVKKYAKLVTH